MPGETKQTAGNEQSEGIIRVTDVETLEEAVEKVRDNVLLTTIVVGAGVYQITDQNTNQITHLHIPSAVNIVGDPDVSRDRIVIEGGVNFTININNCHLQHLTLRGGGNGVTAWSPFTMEDVLVEECEYYGIRAFGSGAVGRCTDVEVHQCRYSGVEVDDGAVITLVGGTRVYDNCIGDQQAYGLNVAWGGGNILFESPLTKEQVSTNNDGGRNWSLDLEAGGQPGGQSTVQTWQGVERLLRF